MSRYIYPRTSLTRSAIGRLGAACGNLRPEPERVPDLLRDVRAAQLEDHVAYVLSQAPPLTDEQRARIVALLGGGE
ncbi:hypothetical protein [Rhodococcus daqingensis]|uniref:Uncharacterized protein n=1 Tax=Rhodococcus daqingensis TaxID=2479363 RepID=A0ABW2RUZ2_9NOCA